MNINLLQIITKFIEIVLVSFIATTSDVTVKNYEIVDTFGTRENAVNSIIEYETLKKYSSSVPVDVVNTLVKGENGLKIIQNGEEKILKNKTDEIIQVGTGKKGKFQGSLTEYGPDCKTCDGKGITNCPTKTKEWHNLINDGIYYNDDQFKEVRILAADYRQFPCGTIIEIRNSDFESTLGVVLDTGYGMKKAYKEGWILIDMAIPTEKKITFGINKTTIFNVRRWGW